MHEDPAVFNFRVRGGSPTVKPGLVLAIEPMITLGGIETHELADGWTQVTDDGSDAAHWEHSVAVTPVASGCSPRRRRRSGSRALRRHPVPIPTA